MCFRKNGFVHERTDSAFGVCGFRRVTAVEIIPLVRVIPYEDLIEKHETQRQKKRLANILNLEDGVESLAAERTPLLSFLIGKRDEVVVENIPEET